MQQLSTASGGTSQTTHPILEQKPDIVWVSLGQVYFHEMNLTEAMTLL